MTLAQETSPCGVLDAVADAQTLVEVLQIRGRQQAEITAFTFLEDGETSELSVSYGELARRARVIAASLQAHGVAPGDRVLLLYPPGLEYLAGFFGCLYAGVIAVPAYPPDPSRLERMLPRIEAIVADAGTRHALTTGAIASMAEFVCERAPALKSLQWLVSDDLDVALEAAWREPTLSTNDVAFLQYTSGSTGSPKGVVLTHANLLHNSQLISSGFGLPEAPVGVIWLPPYHDMGLIGGLLQPVYAQIPTVLMSPLAFLHRPLRWLEAISRYRGTVSGGPNFAFDLCVRKSTPAQRAALDLSRWQVAFTGAEPVRFETLERFAAAFAVSGFRREAFYPCYGLAESTLIVSGGDRRAPVVVQSIDKDGLHRGRADVARNEAPAVSLVGCGRGLLDLRVEIVDPKTNTVCAPREVGEIWVAGRSVARGYWGRPNESEQTFEARLADGEGPFLRTGDLGFVLPQGDLFVTGRSKDLIIIRGRNHYPQDIEQTVEAAHPALRPGCGAAFAIEVDNDERVVIVQEYDRRYRPERRSATAPPGIERRQQDRRQDPEGIAFEAELARQARERQPQSDQQPNTQDVCEAIRAQVLEHHQLAVHAVVLIKAGTISKTSSGKIQRRATRAEYLDGTLDVIDSWSVAQAPAPATELPHAAKTVPPPQLHVDDDMLRWVSAQVARVAGVAVDTVRPDHVIARMGLDSLRSVELQAAIEEKLGVALPLASLLGSKRLVDLAQDLQGLIVSGPQRPPLVVAATEASTHELSDGQRALWFLHELAPESAAYSIARAARIDAPIDVAALRTAFTGLVSRHPALRTTFERLDGEPLARVARPEAAPPVFVQVDARGWNPADLDARLREEAERPFDLAQGPLFRATLFSQSDDRHVLALVIHHLVADLWSLGVVVQEIGVRYAAACAGRHVELPRPPVSFADYARWHSEVLRSPAADRAWTYWQAQLAGAPAALELPTDRPRPAVQTFSGATITRVLPPALAAALTELARAHSTTLFTVLLTSFAALLARYSGQDDVVVGAPVAGREHAAVEGVVGYFVNVVPLRVQIAGKSSFAGLLARVRETVLGALAHQELPLARLVERLALTRDPSRSPLFQTMFVLQQARLPGQAALGAFALELPDAALDVGGLRATPEPIAHRVAQFDLALSMAETDAGLGAVFEYNTDLFDAETVQHFADHFAMMLAAAVARPTHRVDDLALLDAPTRQRILVDWNAGPADTDARCVPALISAVAARAPHHPALRAGAVELSYAALEARATELARALRAAGVGPEDIVGVSLERSPELIVALLAVLKSGGAYLPLDPALPPERRRFMVEDARVRVAIASDAQRAELAALGVRVLDPSARAPGVSIDLPEPTGAQAAYVIYTSGSTGVPKGVLVAHRELAGLARTQAKAYELTAADRALQFASVAFDTSAEEIFTTLVAGATLVLRDEEMLASPQAFVAACRAAGITVLNIPTAYWHEIVGTGDASPLTDAPPAGLRLVVIGGEAARPDHVARWMARAPAGLRLLNAYGPTEAVVTATEGRLAQGSAARGAVSIGRPLPGAAAYVLDRRGEPTPVGLVGELHLGGRLARGYLARPGLTAARFLPDPFSGAPGARMYATGDLARWCADGTLEYLGRNDQQVKLRGFRIELGEIEVVLASHPAVGACVVLAREDAPGDQRLVAYIVPRTGTTVLDAAALRAHAAARLPQYMVPAAVVALDAIPLTTNGKVDRRALPAPARSTESTIFATDDPREAVLALIFAELLGVPAVGADDDFFALGGHSLLATRLVARVRARLDVELPVRAVFEAPTVARLAARVARAAEADGPALVPLPRGGSPLPTSFAQARLWFLDQLEPGGAMYNMPAAVRLSGTLDVTALSAALSTVLARHEALRTRFAAIDGQPVQIIDPPAPLALPIVDVADRETAAALAGSEATTPFDLARGPLLRARLLRLAPTEHVLLVTLHHVASDGWSIGVLVREIGALYAAYAHDAPDPLPPLPVQYADYAAWQRAWLAGPRLDAQLAYWRTQLAGAPAALTLPTDRPRAAIPSGRGGTLAVRFAPATVAALEALARAEGATPFMVLLAAWAATLGRLARQHDVVVGSPIAGRTRAETESLIGFFVNTLALRVDLTGAPSFRELLARVRESTLGAYAHQDVPFEKLVEALEVPRDLARAPLFQAMLVLQNAPAPPLEIPGLRLELLADEAPRPPKFDLLLSLADAEGALEGTLEYDAGLFDRDRVVTFADAFATLLDGALRDPAASVARLPLVPAAARAQVLAWAVEPAPPLEIALVHAALDVQAARTPDAPAIVTATTELSYAELHRRANQLAHYLRARGARPGVLIGLCLERTLALPIAMLAVLKTGAAYVPLDPGYPPERLAGIAADAALALLITEQALRERLPATDATPVLLDALGPVLAAQPTTPLPYVGSADDLALVLYTSGSTGRPKGVALTHGGTVPVLRWFTERFAPEERRGVLFGTSINFDMSLPELFGTLATGGVVVLADSVLALPTHPAAGRVTLVNTVPSAMAALLAAGSLPPALRTVLLAGEALSPALAQRLYAVPTVTRVCNGYGPTETSYATFATVTREAPPTIGRPLGGWAAYVLDAALEPVPVGVPGELYISGVGLARGYFGRAALTAERFVPHPFATSPGDRMYKTGDLATWRADGTLEFLGRADAQVKIRGFRVEPGEVENVLASHPDVRTAAVIARPDATGVLGLVAYAEPRDGRALDPAVLRTYAESLLAPYMVPAVIVPLPQLPRTPNGKIDRQDLLKRQGDLAQQPGTAYVAPRTPTEAKLAAIWAELLGRETVGIHDSFFALGGHSLLATQLVSRMRDAFSVEIPLRALFEKPTIAQLVETVVLTRAVETNDDELARLLDEIDALDESEAETQLKDPGSDD